MAGLLTSIPLPSQAGSPRLLASRQWLGMRGVQDGYSCGHSPGLTPGSLFKTASTASPQSRRKYTHIFLISPPHPSAESTAEPSFVFCGSKTSDPGQKPPAESTAAPYFVFWAAHWLGLPCFPRPESKTRAFLVFWAAHWLGLPCFPHPESKTRPILVFWAGVGIWGGRVGKGWKVELLWPAGGEGSWRSVRAAASSFQRNQGRSPLVRLPQNLGDDFFREQ